MSAKSVKGLGSYEHLNFRPSQIFCYQCVEYIKLDIYTKFHDHRSNSNKVMMGDPHAPPPPPPPPYNGSKKPMSNRLKCIENS